MDCVKHYMTLLSLPRSMRKLCDLAQSRKIHEKRNEAERDLVARGVVCTMGPLATDLGVQRLDGSRARCPDLLDLVPPKPALFQVASLH